MVPTCKSVAPYSPTSLNVYRDNAAAGQVIVQAEENVWIGSYLVMQYLDQNCIWSQVSLYTL